MWLLILRVICFHKMFIIICLYWYLYDVFNDDYINCASSTSSHINFDFDRRGKYFMRGSEGSEYSEDVYLAEKLILYFTNDGVKLWPPHQFAIKFLSDTEFLKNWRCWKASPERFRVLVLILWVFPLFLKKVADIIAPKLSIIFCRLIHPGCIRQTKKPAQGWGKGVDTLPGFDE